MMLKKNRTALESDNKSSMCRFNMKAEIKFTLDTMDDVSDKTKTLTYAVSGNVGKDLDVELHNKLSKLEKPCTYEKMVEILRSLYQDVGYVVTSVEGESLSTKGYMYVERDFVGDSKFVIEYDVIGI